MTARRNVLHHQPAHLFPLGSDMLSLKSVSSLAVAFCLVASLIAGQEPVQQRGRSIVPTVSVHSFDVGRVVGYLGHPLGTVVRVTGVGALGQSKADGGDTLLQIETVNGKSLPKAWVVPFLRAARGISKPRPEERFDFYVHEYGTFDGVVAPPPNLGIDNPVVQNDGFYYRPAVTIHKSNGPSAGGSVQR